VDTSTKPPVKVSTEVGESGDFPGVENRCLNISASLPGSIFDVPEGVILLSAEVPGDNSYLLDIENGAKFHLENLGKQEINFLNISPNRQWLAYIVSNRYLKDETIIIATSDGAIMKTYDLPPLPGGGGIQQWLDNERLWIGYGEGTAPDAYSLMLNPFTGEQKEFQSTYSNLYNLNPPWFWGDYNQVRTIYNPTLTRVIYPAYKPSSQFMKNGSTFPLGSIVLWDLQSQKMVANFFVYPGLIRTQPVWSPDGSQFVIDFESSFLSSSVDGEDGHNIYLVDQNGQIEKITSFKPPTPYGDFSDYAWSPDGKTIAFWLRVGATQENDHTYDLYQLAILDVIKKQITNYCIPAYRSSVYAYYAPIWSPDGKYLAISANLRADIKSPKDEETAVIVNLFDGWAYPIANDVIPMGWMPSIKK
jgi:hypothetical protein